MPDGHKWDVPISVIAEHRANYYKKEFDGNLERSLKEDTIPLFEEDEFEIEDWAANNMNWSEVIRFATRASFSPEVDYQEGWVNGKKELI